MVNSITGQPIPNALVQISGPHAALTDRDGQFEFRDLADGSSGHMAATTTEPGYFPEQPGTIDSNLPVAEDHGITLKLIPEAILSGKVIDENGQPLQGLRVLLKTLQVHDGLRRWQQVQSRTTSVDGEFRFAELRAGKYSLATGFEIDGLPDAISSVAFAPVIYPPRGGDEEAALALAAGDHMEVSLSPPMQRIYAVTGRVDGPPAQGFNFEVESSSGGTISPVVRFNRPNGEFRLFGHPAVPIGSNCGAFVATATTGGHTPDFDQRSSSQNIPRSHSRGSRPFRSKSNTKPSIRPLQVRSSLCLSFRISLLKTRTRMVRPGGSTLSHRHRQVRQTNQWLFEMLSRAIISCRQGRSHPGTWRRPPVAVSI